MLFQLVICWFFSDDNNKKLILLAPSSSHFSCFSWLLDVNTWRVPHEKKLEKSIMQGLHAILLPLLLWRSSWLDIYAHRLERSPSWSQAIHIHALISIFFSTRYYDHDDDQVPAHHDSCLVFDYMVPTWNCEERKKRGAEKQERFGSAIRENCYPRSSIAIYTLVHMMWIFIAKIILWNKLIFSRLIFMASSSLIVRLIVSFWTRRGTHNIGQNVCLQF